MPNIAFLTGPQDPSQLIASLNGVISSVNSGVEGLIAAATTAVATGTGTTEQTLQTITVAPNTLAAVGQSLRIRAWGVTGATANNKTMKLYFGASVITTPTAATNAKGWYLELNVLKTGASTQAVIGTGIVDTTAVTPYNNAGTDTDTAGVVVKLTGTDGTSAAADITCNAMIIEMVK